MTLIANFCALISILYIVKVLLYPFFKPISAKQKKRMRRYTNDKKKAVFYLKLKGIKRYIALNYISPLMQSIFKNLSVRYSKIIMRLDLQKKPEEILLEQILYALVAALLSLFMFKVNNFMGFVSSIFIILGWLYPVDELETIIDRKNKNISLDFPAFYSMLYYQYSKSVNIHLTDVIRDYLPNANRDMAEEMDIMLDNIEYKDEEYALKQLKKRVPVRYVIKFCDIMETRLKGYDNVSQMTYLKNEIDEFRILALEKELERRNKSNERVQFVLVIVLMMYITIYYVFTIIDSLKLYQ